jgi:ribonuclease HI
MSKLPKNTKTKPVIIYTDGSSLGNPGPGGYGVVLRYGDHEKELSGGFRCTTNNRMELLAAIKALQALKRPCRVKLHTDSQYLVNAIEKGWAKRWQRNGWMRNRKDRALNPDLWAELLPLTDRHDVELLWVRGHAGNPDNERCDTLAKEAADAPNLPPDEVYEQDHTC